MITCPNCAHQNPIGAVNCEACFTPLPTAVPMVGYIQCPSCQSSVLSDAKFCGHCGFNLSEATIVKPTIKSAELSTEESTPKAVPDDVAHGDADEPIANIASNLHNLAGGDVDIAPETEPQSIPVPIPAPPKVVAKTQLQQLSASLLHVQTNLNIEIPTSLPVVHIGKPNNVIPPDIDVSGFPDSDIVSRIHADIRVEGGSFFFEDTGSSNGTYINNFPLPTGNRHKLRAGDRISLGKGDKVSFIFQLNS